MKDVVIVSACRTAIGKFGGSLKELDAPTIAGVAMKGAIERAGIDPVVIDDVRFGCAFEHPDNNNTARVASLMAGVPADTSTAVTVNRVCISGMEAVVSGMAMIQTGLYDVVLAGGVEHMSSVPFSVLNARWGCRLQDSVFVDNLIHGLHGGSKFLPGPENGPAKEGPILEFGRGKPYIMGYTADLVGEYCKISREDMDEVALRSHNNVERATKDGSFSDEIVPVEVLQRKKPPIIFKKDEHFIPGLTIEKLAALKPAFVPKIGKVTAGNASGMNDGAAAMIIMSADKAKELGVTPIARIKAIGSGGCHPSVMGLSPVASISNLMSRSGLNLNDFELIEINEAFAAQFVAVERELGINREITNINGSGIGLGHPVGATGCRIMVTLLHAMKKRGNTLGLASLCGGGGVSMAVALEML